MSYSREYQEKLLSLVEGYLSEESLIDDIMGYFSSDETCACLESICRDYDIDIDEVSE